MPIIESRISLARRIELLDRKIKSRKANIDWFKQKAEAADLLLEEDFGISSINVSRGDNIEKQKKELNTLQEHLNRKLEMKVIPQFLSVKYINPSQQDVQRRISEGKTRNALNELNSMKSIPQSSRSMYFA